MFLRALRSFGVASLLVCLGASLSSCGTCHESCDSSSYSAFSSCIVTKDCAIDGTPVTTCAASGATPSCPLWKLGPGQVLSIPLADIWTRVGNRNDVVFWHNGPAPGASLATAKVQFDGATAACTFVNSAIQCDNVPRTVKAISFEYSGPQVYQLYVDFRDTGCVSECQY